jgi:uncharacterized membrane protein YdjX (TVP38/TMEM64 family)
MSDKALRAWSRGENGGWLRRHGRKLIALCFWLLLLGGYQWYAWSNDLGPFEAVRQLSALLASGYGPLLFIALYIARPLVLFPATALTLAAGLLFGPFWGTIYTLIGSNGSATVAFYVGRFFGQGLLDGDQAESIVQRYAERLRHNSFTAVLTMRCAFLPYDLVSYLAGLLAIRYRAFILATILGSLPGTLAFVLAGASIQGDLSSGLPGFDPRVFAASAAIFGISLAIARVVQRREQHDKG